jgi:hypothetical protein
MANPTPSTIKTGDRVKILHTNIIGRVVELRGPLGPNGAQIYRVRWGRKRPFSYVEVREDQLEVIPPEVSGKP